MPLPAFLLTQSPQINPRPTASRIIRLGIRRGPRPRISLPTRRISPMPTANPWSITSTRHSSSTGGKPRLRTSPEPVLPGPAESVAAGRYPMSEVGIGIITDARPSIPPPTLAEMPANQGLNIGPALVTEEFGWRSATSSSQGRSIRTPTATPSTLRARAFGGFESRPWDVAPRGLTQRASWGSGGYSLDLPPGTYDVTASGVGLASPRTTTITIGSDNVGWDVVVPVPTPSTLVSRSASAPVVTPPPASSTSVPVVSTTDHSNDTPPVLWEEAQTTLSPDDPASYGANETSARVIRPSPLPRQSWLRVGLPLVTPMVRHYPLPRRYCRSEPLPPDRLSSGLQCDWPGQESRSGPRRAEQEGADLRSPKAPDRRRGLARRRPSWTRPAVVSQLETVP